MKSGAVKVVERVKEQSAAELLQILKKALIQSDEVATKFLCGLMTNGEIEDLLKRDAVHQEITDRLAKSAKLSMKAVAEKCDCSTDLVARVWKAICDEYPSATSTPATARIAIPKEERAQAMVVDILAHNGFRIEIQDNRTKTGVVVDMRENLAPIPCQIIAGQDMFNYLAAGSVQSAFVGRDKIEENKAAALLEGRDPTALDIRKQFRVDAFRMCLAIPKEDAATAASQGLGYFENKVIVTSYPATTEQYLAENGVKAKEIISLKGGVEQARQALGANAIVDVVESGGSLKRSGLVPFKANEEAPFGEPVYLGDMSLISLPSPRRNAPLASFVSRLAEPAR